MQYRIEADSDLARSDPQAYLEDLGGTMGRRFAAAFKLMETEPWDFFHLHLMGIDRVNHFFWDAYEEGDAELSQAFFAFYRKLDSYLGDLTQALQGNCRLILVSDHGFCRCRSLVYVNQWLEANGYLLFGRGKKELLTMHPESRAYSLVPGRVFVNLQGREEYGSVSRGKEYEDLRDELVHRMSGITHPKTGQPLVGRIFRREEIYRGPQLGRAADLIIEPQPGFDLKANLDGPGLLGPPDLPGMHDPSGAFVCFGGQKNPLQAREASILDLAPTILNLLNLEVPSSMEGDILI